MPSIITSIEIAASPATVRAKFLDFKSLPEYSPGAFITSIQAKNPDEELVPGSKLTVVLDGMGTFESTVLENSPSCFSWRGSLPYIFTGDHSFRFDQGKTGPQSTTLVQSEQFSGLLGFTMGENMVANAMGMGIKTKKGFEKLNEDLKKACEQGGQ